MSPDKTQKPTKLCPTCGTRVSEDATRCLVCGTELASAEKPSRPTKAVQGSRMPEVTLSLPAVLGLFAMFLVIGAGMVWFAFNQNGTSQAAGEPTQTPTQTLTVTPTLSPTAPAPTVTNTPEPSPTPQVYTVKLNDTCGGIAFAFGVSVNSIVLMNNLPADCSTLYENQKLMIPQPTPTATAMPTATLSEQQATEAACQKVEYTVQENDTLSSIALNHAVPAEAIREYNGLVSDIVRFGQELTIPLCKRAATPGPSPTPTPPPPYPAPNLLLPPDGSPFASSSETITLQWASVGTLRENETYAVTIEDVTEGQGRRMVEYVSDTKLIVPVDFLPADGNPHVVRWWVLTVRQTGTDNDGNPIWEPAGAASDPRDFIWAGVPGGGAAPAPATTPTP